MMRLCWKDRKNLWSQNIGSKVDFERRELALKNSKNSYASVKEKLKGLQQKLDFLSKQAQNNLSISNENTGDYLVKSKVGSRVYQRNLAKGEMVRSQIPNAVIAYSEKTACSKHASFARSGQK